MYVTTLYVHANWLPSGFLRIGGKPEEAMYRDPSSVGAYLKRCVCGTKFVGRVSFAKYCCAECRYRAHQEAVSARDRERRRQKREARYAKAA